MPKKKIQQTHAEKTAENYFPVDETDLRYTIEKPYKEPIKVTETIVSTGKTIEKTPKKRAPRKKNSKKRTSKSPGYNKNKPVNKIGDIPSSFSPSSIKLKDKGYELIITEKPQAAEKIASALGAVDKRNFSGISYYEVDRKGKQIVVACAVGHLFTLKQNTRAVYPVFDVSWVPNYMAKKNDFTKKYHDTILRLARNAGSITIATDYDIEGEVIGLNAVRFICSQKDANRMKFSTLTSSEINDAYENKSLTLNWGQAIAGETRHYLDWFYGINLSRALMEAIKATGRFKLMSIGRVQGPALHLLVDKERQIQAFVSKPYWQIFIAVKNSHEIELKYNKDIFDKKELSKFESLLGKTAEAITKKKQQILPPSPPFNLTELQMESYRLFGITPARTLQVAQSLYLGGLISYPRTSSQKLPDSINYKIILEQLSRRYNAEHLISRNKPVEGKKSDPAHPSIYPTGQNGSLSGEEEKIYNLIVKRFLALFCNDAIIDNKTIEVKIDDLTFNVKGAEIKKKGWLEIYPVKIHETELPDVNGKVKITNVRTEEKETQPPRRYTEASIIAELEKRNLGTKATRANIIETLYDRKYIKEKSIEATPLGISLISSLEKYSPIIIDEKLTRNFEKEMEAILESKRDFEIKEKRVIDEAKVTITKIIQDFNKNEKDIGNELIKADTELRQQEREENKLNQCPVCKQGNLAIKYSKMYRKSFVACDRYPECKTTYSLPTGYIKKANKVCEECGFPMLMRLTKGKRPWTFCFNKDCKTNKERLEEYKKKLEGKNNQEE
ncbi:MAG TPA: DNA topoisomerase I [Patescibacteria group bacterium]|nr:DNA topoisomerase I [Patescibacteria group bacterium]